jgi:hypothetical protein
VLRLIRQSRWDSPGTYDWLAAGDIPADPLADFANTTENSLSVWFLRDDRQDLDDLLAALAASREKADKLDYVVFTEKHLKDAEIDVSAAIGRTPDERVNGQHRDLTRLSAAKVVSLVTKVWRDNLGPTRLDERTVVQLVACAVRDGRISHEKLRPQLRDSVLSCLGDQRDVRRKPK